MESERNKEGITREQKVRVRVRMLTCETLPSPQIFVCVKPLCSTGAAIATKLPGDDAGDHSGIQEAVQTPDQLRCLRENCADDDTEKRSDAHWVPGRREGFYRIFQIHHTVLACWVSAEPGIGLSDCPFSYHSGCRDILRLC